MNGRQIRRTLATDDEETAHRAAAEIKRDPEKGGGLWVTELNAYLRDRETKGRMSKGTVDVRRAVLMQFAESQKVESPRLVTTAHVSRWHEGLTTRKKKPVAAETAQNYVRYLRTFLAYLAKRGYPLRMPKELELPRVKKRPRKPFCSPAEVATLIAAAPDDEMRFILFCGFHAGLRRGEIAQARPEWFDLKAGLLHLQRSETWEPKDRDERTIPLTKDFLSFLEKYGLRAPFMLAGKKKNGPRKWRYRYDFRRPFEEMMEAAGMKWVTPHTMRRSFASNLVSAGVSLYKVAIWLGDLERVVQDHYGSLIPKDADIERGL